MITITINSNPQEQGVIAATDAHNAANPDNQLTPTEYLQARVEEVCLSYAQQFSVGSIFPGDYILRFTAAENAAITASADPVVQGFLAEVRSASRVVLYSDEVVQGHAYLVASALLTQTRSDEILAY
jgi:hypothetical protein